MCGNYARMVNEGAQLLRQINPNTSAGRYCPEAADAVHDFLNTGEVTPVTITGLSTFPMQYGGLAPVAASQLSNGMSNCTHRVIRGTRTNNQTHWFVVLRYQGVLYVADSMLHILTRNVAAYLQQQSLSTLHRVTGGYDVRPEDPLGMALQF